MRSRREILRTTWPEVRVCENAGAKCTKRYGKPIPISAHTQGFVDNWNTIHLTNLDRRVRGVGLYWLVYLAGVATVHDYDKLKPYYQLWKRHVWAHRELNRLFHKRSRVEWTYRDRVKAWRLAEKDGMTVIKTGDMFYLWCYRGREMAMRAGFEAGSRHRYRVPEWMKQAWVEDRKNGLSFNDIGKKYGRDFRAVWKVMVRSGLHEKGMG